MTRILHVIASMDPEKGGPSQGLRNIIPALISMGTGSQVLCLDEPSSEFLKIDFFPVHAIGKSKGVWQYHPGLIRWLEVNLRKFDVVIVHGLWLYPNYAVYKTLKKELQRQGQNKIPALYIMAHGMLDPYFQKAKARKLKAIRNKVYWNLVEKKIIAFADGILFTCKEELILARQTFKSYHPKKELNVGYGIAAPPAFHKDQRAAFLEKCPFAQNNPYLIFLSRIHPKKGVELLINAYLNLREKGFDLPKLVIAGPGLETAYGAEMKKLAAQSEDIFFPGMLTGDAKWGAMYGSEAFVLPSHQENFGIAVVEAMACSKPVLITDQVNIWREVKATEGGIISTNTAEAVVVMLEKWISMTIAGRRQIAVNAREAYKKYFTVENAAARLLQQVSKKEDYHHQNSYQNA